MWSCRFLKSRPNTEEFLEQLLHFQHFRQFINTKIDKLKNSRLERDLFDTEVMTYEEGISCYNHYVIITAIYEL